MDRILAITLVAAGVLAGGLPTNGAAAETNTITVALMVPDGAWKVTIEEVYEANGELLVISRVSRDPSVMGIQMITTASDTVTVDCAQRPTRHYVLGKTWKWPNQEAITFMTDLEPISKELQSAKCLFQKTAGTPAQNKTQTNAPQPPPGS